MTEATIRARATIPIYDAAALSASAEKRLPRPPALGVYRRLPLEAVTPEFVPMRWDAIAIMSRIVRCHLAAQQRSSEAGVRRCRATAP